MTIRGYKLGNPLTDRWHRRSLPAALAAATLSSGCAGTFYIPRDAASPVKTRPPILLGTNAEVRVKQVVSGLELPADRPMNTAIGLMVADRLNRTDLFRSAKFVPFTNATSSPSAATDIQIICTSPDETMQNVGWGKASYYILSVATLVLTGGLAELPLPPERHECEATLTQGGIVLSRFNQKGTLWAGLSLGPGLVARFSTEEVAKPAISGSGLNFGVSATRWVDSLVNGLLANVKAPQ